jgi:hypothetical protein
LRWANPLSKELYIGKELITLKVNSESEEIFIFPMARQPLGGLGRLIFRGFMITHFRHTTLGRTPLDEGPVRRRDLYLTTHNTHNRQISMPPAGFEPTILVSERPQTHALDRTTTGIGFGRARMAYLFKTRKRLSHLLKVPITGSSMITQTLIAFPQ